MFHFTKDRNFLFSFPVERERELVYTFNPLTISTLYFDSVSRFLTKCNESDQIPRDTRGKKKERYLKLKRICEIIFLKPGYSIYFYSLMIDVFQDQRVFLVPWIIVVITTCFVDVAHSLYLFIVAVSISFFYFWFIRKKNNY